MGGVRVWDERGCFSLWEEVRGRVGRGRRVDGCLCSCRFRGRPGAFVDPALNSRKFAGRFIRVAIAFTRVEYLSTTSSCIHPVGRCLVLKSEQEPDAALVDSERGRQA